jgi:hypothetical protein
MISIIAMARSIACMILSHSLDMLGVTGDGALWDGNGDDVVDGISDVEVVVELRP